MATAPAPETLRKRKDFVAAARARKAATPGLILQRRARNDESSVVRVGFTASKKVGNAVMRNRAKRRLRALAREVLSQRGTPGHDFVLIARRDATIGRAFDDLRRDLISALDRIEQGKR
jgi:ribonuclease P protein component